MRQAMMAAAMILATAATPARAEVKAADANGLIVAQTISIAAPPAAVYATLIAPARWWDPAHSWSGDAANMTFDPVAGGCFCEKLPASGGSAEHARVTNIVPGKLVRLRGALGPFQAMGVSGALSWELKPVEGGTDFVQTYAVGGFMPGGFQSIAPAVEG